MSDPADAELFPLPLAAFEQYMLTDDCAEYPADFFVRLRFAGRMDRPALEAAAAAALRRHPLLRAVVRARGKGRFEWVPAESPNLPFTWHAGARPVASAADLHIDLRRRIGWHVHVAQQDDQAEMLCQFHHACCDGLGAMRFIEDVLAGYHNALSPPGACQALRALDPGRLRQRGKFGLSPLKYLLRAHKELLGLLGSTEYFMHRPVPLAGSAPLPDAAACEFPAIFAHTFSAADTDKLRKLVAQIGGTVNDLLLRDLFVAISAWNVGRDPQLRNRFVRIMIPTNLRNAGDEATPAANVVSMVHLDRRPHSASSLRGLSRLARLEMKICKNWRLGLTTIHYMQFFRLFPGGLRKLIPTHRCLATTVLSNLGDITRDMALPRRDGRLVAGNLTLEAIDAVPPIRTMTHASFGVLFYAGRLTIALQYDARRFTGADGADLLSSYVRQIETSLQQLP